MENEVVTVQEDKIIERDLGVVTNEIKHYWRMGQQAALSCIIEVGCRLCEAKAMIKHGEWTSWLEENFEFSQRQANNFMLLFKEYGSDRLSLFGMDSNSHTFANLPYSKALQLLQIPREEREEFAQQVGAEDLSLSELKNAIEGRKEAEKAAADAKLREHELSKKLASAEIAKAHAESKAADADKIREQVLKLEADIEKRKKSEKDLKAKLKEAQTNPKVSDELLSQLRADAEAKAKAAQDAQIEKRLEEVRLDSVADLQNLEKALEEAKAAQEIAEKAKIQAEAAAKTAIEQLQAVQKKLKLANPKVTLFKTLFEEFQETYSKLNTVLSDIASEDPELAQSLFRAIKSFGNQIEEEKL